MIDIKDFAEMKKKLEEFDEQRESLVSEVRNIVRLSKRIIYSVHRNDEKSSDESVAEIRKIVKATMQKVRKEPALLHSGLLKSAIQEYVEAVCFYEIIRNKRIPTHKELDVQPEHYLLGICDLTGELSRRSVNAAAGADYKTALEMKGIVSEIYDEMMQFDFANGELRKKFDSIKYEVKRLEEMALTISLDAGKLGFDGVSHGKGN
ncbi:hypothetical protein COT07_02910 [Candidatus Woesearchaeota archaeon CG07_land_8_20_14_0_80_44_23]|nr:MAG: hypothetical protein COT07_02910 [Candidatus Woesearchaeota archaeon CG07_land_8_20_14_0_80_44_23]